MTAHTETWSAMQLIERQATATFDSDGRVHTVTYQGVPAPEHAPWWYASDALGLTRSEHAERERERAKRTADATPGGPVVDRIEDRLRVLNAESALNLARLRLGECRRRLDDELRLQRLEGHPVDAGRLNDATSRVARAESAVRRAEAYLVQCRRQVELDPGLGRLHDQSVEQRGEFNDPALQQVDTPADRDGPLVQSDVAVTEMVRKKHPVFLDALHDRFHHWMRVVFHGGPPRTQFAEPTVEPAKSPGGERDSVRARSRAPRPDPHPGGAA